LSSLIGAGSELAIATAQLGHHYLLLPRVAQDVGDAAEREERDEGLLVGAGEGAQWYVAMRTGKATVWTWIGLTYGANSNEQRPMGTDGQRHGRHCQDHI